MNSNEINWLYIPFLLTFLQGFITAISIFKSRQNISLAILVLLIAFGALLDTGLFRDDFLPVQLIWSGNEFLFGPLLYLAVHKQLLITVRQKLVHFYIFTFMKMFVILALVFPAFLKAIPEWFSLLLSIFLCVHGISYTVFCLYQLYKKKFFVHTKEIIWVKWLVWMCLIAWILALLAKIIRPINMFGANSLFYFVYMMMLIVVYYISYKITDHIFPKIPVVKEKIIVEEQLPEIEAGASSIKKYSKSSLSKEQIQAYKKAITAYFEKDRPYMDIDFSFQQLSGELNIKPHYLSQTFNEGFGKTYPQLIKELRIQEASKRIVDEQYSHLSVYGIALDCGFNSKSAFNQAFKEITGFTPSEYKKSKT